MLRVTKLPNVTYLNLRNLYAGQKATVRTRHGKTGSKSGKEYVKAVDCHLAYLRIRKVELLLFRHQELLLFGHQVMSDSL